MTQINGRYSENSTSDHDKESEPKKNATFETRGKGTLKNDILLTISNFYLKPLRLDILESGVTIFLIYHVM